MPFIHMKGIKGLVYLPGAGRKRKKKHPCPDCDICQRCSDTRCAKCLKQKTFRPVRRRTRVGTKVGLA